MNFLISKNRFLRLISIFWVCATALFLILGFAPLFYEKPNWENFQLTQATEYIFIWNPTNSEITENSDQWKQTIKLTNSEQKLFLIESDTRTINFDEKVKLSWENNMFVIKLPDSTTFVMYPWSKVKISKTGKYYIDKEYGNIEYYQPNNNIHEVSFTYPQEQKNKSDFILWYMIDDYESKKIDYIISQWWWTIIQEEIYQKFSKQILLLAHKIRPDIYANNLENYTEYKKLLWRTITEKSLEKDENRRNSFLNNIKKWREETRNFKQSK